MCVPGWQQTQQGAFNGILNKMEQEVTWTGTDSSTKTGVKSWGIDWASHGALGLGRRGEKPTEEEMFNIKRVEIAEDVPVHEIFIPFDNAQPAQATRSIGKHRRHGGHHA